LSFSPLLPAASVPYPMRMPTLFVAAAATVCVGWFAFVQSWLDPMWQRLVGRALGVPVRCVFARMGILKARIWVTLPEEHARAPLVALTGAMSTLMAAIAPAVALALLARCFVFPPDWSAPMAFMSVLTCPVGVAAQMSQDPGAFRR
jgi:hypothetical protein